MLGNTEGRRRGWQRTKWLDGIINSMDMSLGKLWEMVKDRGAWSCSPWGCKESDVTELLNNRWRCIFIDRMKVIFALQLTTFKWKREQGTNKNGHKVVDGLHKRNFGKWILYVIKLAKIGINLIEWTNFIIKGTLVQN